MDYPGGQPLAIGNTGQRTSVSGAARTSRQRQSSHGKSWIQGDVKVRDDAGRDAREMNIDMEAAQNIVTFTTRFATLMCIVIAIVKVGVYLAVKADVMKTSALDSMGDLMANGITLYTGVRMRRIDKQKYPVGQAKFESLGCLVFSTLMFAMMFGNALSNVEGLMESKDDVGFQAVSRFFYQAAGNMDSDFQKFNKQVFVKEDDGAYDWKIEKEEFEIANPLKPYFEEHGDAAEKKWAKDFEDKVTMKWIIEQVGDYENAAEKWKELMFQNKFLALCATYKLCLWLFCILHAIPKSGSNVLRALATDKRNDFCCTYSIILATTFLEYKKESLPDMLGDKGDPLVSLCISFFIMYSWSDLMFEHLTILSQVCAMSEFKDGVIEDLGNCVQAPCSFHSDDVIVYVSAASKHTIEVNLTANPNAPYKDVAIICENVKRKMQSLDDVDRAIITAKC